MSAVNASASTEFDRNAVVTIQGGGVYAVSLLGQLQAVVKDHRMEPLALAGTSAGAIIATLYWARLSPHQIYEEISRLCEPERGPLTKLLGPFEPPGDRFDFDSLLQFKAEVTAFLSLLTDLMAEEFRGKKIAWYHPFHSFRALMQVKREAQRLYGRLNTSILRRGIFAGEDLESEIDRMIRLAPDLQKYADALPMPPDRVCFLDIKRLMEEHLEECYRPPLFLVTTNLSTRRLELFSSIDEESLTRCWAC